MVMGEKEITEHALVIGHQDKRLAVLPVSLQMGTDFRVAVACGRIPAPQRRSSSTSVMQSIPPIIAPLSTHTSISPTTTDLSLSGILSGLSATGETVGCFISQSTPRPSSLITNSTNSAASSGDVAFLGMVIP